MERMHDPRRIEAPWRWGRGGRAGQPLGDTAHERRPDIRQFRSASPIGRHHL
jgi:hypothetical protein